MNDQSNDKLLTPEEVAEILGVPSTTLKSWRFRGINLPFVRLGHRSVRYWQKDVTAFLSENYYQPDEMPT